jgi:hypothetical protein
MAGAFTFVVDPLSPQPATAHDHAAAAATANVVDNAQVPAGDVSVNVDTVNRRVTVNIAHPEPTYLARVVGLNALTINVTAVAEASPDPVGAYGVKPWFVPNTVFDPTNTPCQACQAGNRLLIRNGDLTSYARSLIAGNGNQFTVKPQSPSSALAPGQFYPFQMTGGESGSQYRTNIAFCAWPAINCGESYTLANGNMSGPTVQGTQDLIGSTPDIYRSSGHYENASTGRISDTSRSLVLTPIFDPCNTPNYCPSNRLPGNNQSLDVVGFGLVFVEGVSNGNVVGRLISVSSCGSSGGHGGCGGVSGDTPAPGPFSLPIRLVRTN